MQGIGKGVIGDGPYCYAVRFPHHCNECGYDWDAYKENPKLCPQCREKLDKGSDKK